MDFDILILIAIIPILIVFCWDIAFLIKTATSRPLQQDAPAKRTVLAAIWKRKLLILNFVVPVLATAVIAGALSPAPRIQTSYPEWEGSWESYTKPITIVFNVPVETAKLRPFLSTQELEGRWEYEPYLGVLPVTRVAKFYPETTLPPNRRLVVYFTGVARLGVDEFHEHPLNLYTHSPAEINRVFPAHNSSETPTNTTIRFELTKENEGLADWEFEISPAIEFSISKPDDKSFILTPATPLAQSENYIVSVYRTELIKNRLSGEVLEKENRQSVHQLSFSTVKAPLVKRFSPNGTGVKVDANIIVDFEIPMNPDSVQSTLSIVPAIDYSINWETERKLVITPASVLPKETQFTLSFPPGLQSLNGGVSEIGIEHRFTTIGAVQVAQFTPRTGTVRVPRNSSFTVQFDQEVDKASAQANFVLSPAVNGSFSWDQNSLTFTPSAPLAFSTTYTITINPGVKSIFGLDSRDAFAASFSTVPNQTIIAGFGPGNWDRQDYNFTCGVAATKMALAWKGISVSEDALISYMGQDGSSMDCNSGTCLWGDPNRNFLGLPNGSGAVGTGQSAYGVHWQPIISVLQNQFGIQTELRRNWNVYDMARTIEQGNPVQIWWWNGVSSYYGSQGGRRIDWVDRSSGLGVEAIHGMHSILVVGFNGEASNPTSFIVLDPWWGYQTYSIAMFNNQWPKLQNTALIVY